MDSTREDRPLKTPRNITVNGEARALPERATVSALLAELGIDSTVGVEVNRELLDARRFDATRLREGDRVEIVRIVGGG